MNRGDAHLDVGQVEAQRLEADGQPALERVRR